MNNAILPPLTIESQHSFAVRGAPVVGLDGQTLHGDHARVLHQRPPQASRLPVVFPHGNTHFPFSDLNNVELAELMAGFLDEKNLS